jgi:hypothetical protein
MYCSYEREENDFIDCIGDSSPDVVCPELAEAMVIRLALSWARDEGLDGFIVASDCLSVALSVWINRP